jgi:cobyrinic acid a,c-diamide synthase
VPPEEHPAVEEAIDTAADVVEKHLNFELLWKISSGAPPLDFHPQEHPEIPGQEITIGIVRDSAFQFYYQENLEALRRAGARLIEFSALKDDLPPSLDALYIGGGFPETHAALLSENTALRRSIKKAADEGLPIYAECGGLMYLAEELLLEGKKYPMTGIFPSAIGVSKRPQGHGYTVVEVEKPNPFFEIGKILHGHEFHYSFVAEMSESSDVYFAFHMVKGQGIRNRKDGFCFRNVLATYTHLHASGSNGWVKGLVNSAAVYKKKCLSTD